MSAQDFLRSQGVAEPAKDAARDKVLAQLGLAARPGRLSKAAAKAQEAQKAVNEALAANDALADQSGVGLLGLPPEKKKREGVKETPILTSLRECQVRVEAGDNHVSILFEGARLFSLNELFALLQYRSYIIFGYKKLWQQLTKNALSKLSGQLGADQPLPHFEACKLTLYRQGRKKIDRDSIEVMFKFIIDALKDDSKKGRPGLFPDDNPDVVQAAEPQQSIGTPMVGIRIEGLTLPPDPDFKPNDLFDHPELAVASKAITASADRSRSARRAVTLEDLGPQATAGVALARQAEAMLAAAKFFPDANAALAKKASASPQKGLARAAEPKAATPQKAAQARPRGKARAGDAAASAPPAAKKAAPREKKPTRAQSKRPV